MIEPVFDSQKAKRWQRIKEIVLAAEEIPSAARSTYVASECGSDAALRQDVELLLEASENAGSFLSRPAAAYFATDSLFRQRKALQPGSVLSSRFRILRLIGEGGMGEVYEADDLEINAPVALKTLRPEISSDAQAIARFRNELHLTRRVTHPNVCRTFDLAHHSSGVTDSPAIGDVVYLTMELLDGVTLAERLRSGPLTTEEAFPIVCQIAEALDAVHKVGVIHRDLKPGNVMLCNRANPVDTGHPQRVVVMDFGLACRSARSDDSLPSLSNSGPLMGTPLYMAPEQLRGHPASVASDIYALGIIMFEMITGSRHFNDISQPDPRLGSSEIPSLSAYSSLDPHWGRVVRRCLSSDPARRFSSAVEVITALAAPAGSTAALGFSATTSADQRHLEISDGKRSLALWKWSALMACLAASLSLAVPFVRHSLLAVLPEPLRNKLSHSHPRQIRSVVLTDILNNTGDPTFDRSIGELLATSLEQSPFLKLFPSAKLPEVLQRMNLRSGEPITALLGLEICKREGLEAEISASISRFGSGYTLVLKAVDADGNEIASDAERSPDVAHIPNMVEKGAARLRSVLGEDRVSLSRYSAPLEQVTSPSLLALKNYSDGKQRLYDGKTEDAVRYFEQALELDPAFAMAREYLGISYNILNDFERSENNYLLATRLTQHVTERERLKIFGDYYLQIKDFSKAISYLKTLCEEYPSDVPAHINLGQAYLSEYRFQEAVSETKTALALQSSVSTLNNLAEIHFLAGDTAESMHITNDVLREHPHESRALYNMARCHLVRREYSEALRYFNTLLETGGNAESRARTGLADLAIAQGHYSEAESQLARGIDLDRRVDNQFSVSMKTLALASAYYDHGKRDKFAAAMGELAGSSQSPSVLFLAGCLYAEAHQLSGARKMLQLLKSPENKFRTPKVRSYVQLLTADIDLSEGNYTAAIEAAREALSFDDSTLGVETLARAYRAAARLPDSIREYERVLTRTNERTEECDGPSFHRVVQADYWLAVLYTRAGNVALARKYLGAFLEGSPRPDMDAPLYRDGILLLQKLQRGAAGEPTPAT